MTAKSKGIDCKVGRVVSKPGKLPAALIILGGLLLISNTISLPIPVNRETRLESEPKGLMNCNICDQLAAEMGELLLRQKKVGDGNEGEAASGASREEVERIETQVRAAKQRLIDHMRLIHGSS